MINILNFTIFRLNSTWPNFVKISKIFLKIIYLKFLKLFKYGEPLGETAGIALGLGWCNIFSDLFNNLCVVNFCCINTSLALVDARIRSIFFWFSICDGDFKVDKLCSELLIFMRNFGECFGLNSLLNTTFWPPCLTSLFNNSFVCLFFLQSHTREWLEEVNWGIGGFCGELVFFPVGTGGGTR